MKLADYLGAAPGKRTERQFQSGLNFRSVCAECNNEILGARYDPELVRKTHEIAGSIATRVHLPVRMEFALNRLVRSVVGHFLAHGLDGYRRGEVGEDLTDFFADETSTFPASLELYCWLYPFNDQLVVNAAAGFFDFEMQQKPTFFMLMKFYPIAFLIVKDGPGRFPYSTVRLDCLLSEAIDDVTVIDLPVSAVPPQRWPETPGERGVVMHTAGSTAVIRKPR